MANDIFFGSSEMDDIKFGSSQVDKVYIGSDLVWPISTTGAVASVTISEPGVVRTGASGNFDAAQFGSASPAGGTGFDSSVTMTFISGANYYVSAISITNGGSGYSVGDVITLKLDAYGGNLHITPPQVTVASIS